jgi:hypothetical protein
LVKPLTVAVVELPLTVAVRLPGDEVAVYEVMLAPPLDAGAVQLTVACALPALALTLVGAPATVAGVTEFDAADAGPVPAQLDAVTVKV